VRRFALLVSVLAAAAAITGCGIANPYSRHQSPGPTTHAAVPAPTDSSAVAVNSSGEVAALRRYTLLSIDWRSHTLARQQRELARLAVAGARAQALQSAASYGAGSTLQRSRVANRGQITSIARGQGPRSGWWIITTQELTTGTGDFAGQPAQAHVYAARLTHTAHGWEISTWSPQS
jgi:hypothetical protein